jgi:hypothetical protein
MAYSTNLVEVNVTEMEEMPVFASPRSDAGVPRQIQLFKTGEAREAALQHLTDAIALYEHAEAFGPQKGRERSR